MDIIPLGTQDTPPIQHLADRLGEFLVEYFGHPLTREECQLTLGALSVVQGVVQMHAATVSTFTSRRTEDLTHEIAPIVARELAEIFDVVL